MGDYLNITPEHFRESINSEIYVDKSELIIYTNKVIETKQKYICVSRPRRFGKTMEAHMLAAFYAYGTNADELFHGLKIENDATTSSVSIPNKEVSMEYINSIKNIGWNEVTIQASK